MHEKLGINNKWTDIYVGLNGAALSRKFPLQLFFLGFPKKLLGNTKTLNKVLLKFAEQQYGRRWNCFEAVFV